MALACAEYSLKPPGFCPRGVERSPKRGISVWVVQGWSYAQVPMVVAKGASRHGVLACHIWRLGHRAARSLFCCQNPGLLAAQAIALMVGEDALAKADVLGRDFHHLIFGNEVQGLFQAHPHRRG